MIGAITFMENNYDKAGLIEKLEDLIDNCPDNSLVGLASTLLCQLQEQ